MAHRIFVDPKGVTWQVWEVRLQPGERHRAETATLNPRRTRLIPEQRENLIRRLHLEQRLAAPVEFDRGWLAFGSPNGSKRLAPIPPDWEEVSDAALNELCIQAVWTKTEGV